MVAPLPAMQARLSSRRSLVRCRVLVALDRNGTMLPNELADACSLSCSRLEVVVHGDGVDYSHERAPFNLGQIVRVRTPQGDAYAITDIGREEAARLREEPPWWVGRR